MFKMVFVGIIIFLITYGGFKALQQLDVFQFESLINEIGVIASVTGFVMLAIAAIVILF